MPLSRRDFATSSLAAGLSVLLDRSLVSTTNGADRGESAYEILAQVARCGLQTRLAGAESGRYTTRLDHELRAIRAGGDAGYLLLLHELVRWARGRGIPIGPGRGATPGSVTLWALGVTQLDPIAHDLIFERFYRPGRLDVHLDVCAHRRDEIVGFFKERFRPEQVCFATDSEFDDSRKIVLANGKVRLRGLPILTLLDRVPRCFPATNAFELLRSANLDGVYFDDEYQGSRAFATLLMIDQPESFEEVTALCAIFRPGPVWVGLVDEYVRRRHGERRQEFHPVVDPILHQTRGLFVYQEQVLQVLHAVGGMDFARAEAARRSLGRKSLDEIAIVAAEFLATASSRVPRHIAETLMARLVRWTGYTFCRAHALGATQLTLASAAAKATFPREFRAAWRAVA